MMGVAFALHLRRAENGTPSAVLGVLALLIGVGWVVLA